MDSGQNQVYLPLSNTTERMLDGNACYHAVRGHYLTYEELWIIMAYV